MTDNNKYIVFPNYQFAGLSNQIMELDIKVGMSLLSGRTLVTPDRINVWSADESPNSVDTSKAKLLDLFDIPVQHLTIEQLAGRPVRTQIEAKWPGESALTAFFCYPTAAEFPAQTRENFRQWRPHSWQFPVAGSDAANADAWVVPHRTLVNYAYFFLTDAETAARLRGELSRIRPKEEYRRLGDRIAADLAPFNAVHIRRGDFQNWWVHPSADQIIANISPVMPFDEPLLICTDSSDQSDYFAPFLKYYKNVSFLDQLIENDYAEAVSKLPVSDARAVSVLTQLIAARADVFAGTLFSTFSSMIHRARGFADPDRKILFVFNPFDPKETPMVDCEFIPVREGEFSWNRYFFKMPEEATPWFREWPEAYRETC